MLIRFFAGAAEAAGSNQREVAVAPEATVADLITDLGANNERLTKVLEVSTFLLDRTPVRDPKVRLGEAHNLDVLPPFAGG